MPTRSASTPLPPQDYLIFHRPRKGYQAEGQAQIGGKVVVWRGTVWTEPWHKKASANEDPFVWDEAIWLYSYCHASQLRRKPNMDRPSTGPGSRLFFCETPAARNKWLRVDSVFVVGEQAAWAQPGTTVPPRLCVHQEDQSTPIWERHLKHGIRSGDANARGHKGVYTYIAETGEGSYLPLDGSGNPTALRIDDIAGLAKRVEDALPADRTTVPCALEPGQADELHERLVKASHARVIRLTSPGPLALKARKLEPIVAGA